MIFSYNRSQSRNITSSLTFLVVEADNRSFGPAGNTIRYIRLNEYIKDK